MSTTPFDIADKFDPYAKKNFGISCYWDPEKYNPLFCLASVRDISVKKGCRIRQCREKPQPGSKYGIIHHRMIAEGRAIENFNALPNSSNKKDPNETWSSVDEIYLAVNKRYRQILDRIYDEVKKTSGDMEQKEKDLEISKQQLTQSIQAFEIEKAKYEKERDLKIEQISESTESDQKIKLEDEAKITQLQTEIATLNDKIDKHAKKKELVENSLYVCSQTIRDMLLQTQALVDKTVSQQVLSQPTKSQSQAQPTQSQAQPTQSQSQAQPSQAQPSKPSRAQALPSQPKPPSKEEIAREKEEVQRINAVMKNVAAKSAQEAKDILSQTASVHVLVRVKCDLTENPPNPHTRPQSSIGTTPGTKGEVKTIQDTKTEVAIVDDPFTFEKPDNKISSTEYNFGLFNDNEASAQCRMYTKTKLKSQKNVQEFKILDSIYKDADKYVQAKEDHEAFVAENIKKIQKSGLKLEEAEMTDEKWNMFFALNPSSSEVQKVLDNIQSMEKTEYLIELTTVLINKDFIDNSKLKFINLQTSDNLLDAITIVSIGGSGSGKTTTTRAMFKYIMDKYLNSYEDFYKGSTLKVKFSEITKEVVGDATFGSIIGAFDSEPTNTGQPHQLLEINGEETRKIMPARFQIICEDCNIDKRAGIMDQLLNLDDDAERCRRSRHTPNNEKGSSRSIKIVQVVFEKNGLKKAINLIDTAGYENYADGDLRNFFDRIIKEKWDANTNFQRSFGMAAFRPGEEPLKTYIKNLIDEIKYEGTWIHNSLDYISAAIASKTMSEGKQRRPSSVKGNFSPRFMHNEIDGIKLLPDRGIVVVLGTFKKYLAPNEKTNAIKTLQFLKTVAPKKKM